MISELIAFRITKAKVKFGVKYRCGHECERSSVQAISIRKRKRQKSFRRINFTLISVSTVFRPFPSNTGKSHPWTTTSVGGTFQRTFKTIGPYKFRQEKVWTNDWSMCISPKLVWTNGPESSLKVSVLTGIVKDALTCYRAPKWPNPEFPRKIPKKYPSGRNSGTPRKYPKNTEKNTKNAHFWYFGGIFSIFSGNFGGKFWESRISGRGVFFRYFFVEIPGRAISGLCSRSGRSQRYWSIECSSLQHWLKRLNEKAWRPQPATDGGCRLCRHWESSPSPLQWSAWRGTPRFRQPVDPVVGDPVRQDNDKI